MSKRKVQSKGKTSSKKATKPKKKVGAKKQFQAMSAFFPKSHTEKVEKDLTSYFAKVAVKKKKKPKKKKPTRKEIIQKYQKYQDIITNYEADREKQFKFRGTIKAASDSAYKDWVKKLPNSNQYPDSRVLWLKEWDESAKENALKEGVVEKGGDGRLAKFRLNRGREYRKAIADIPAMEEKYDYLPLEAKIKEVKGLTPKQIEKKTEVGISSYLTKDDKENDIEITHIFNYVPSAIPIYDDPVLEELAKTDRYGDVDLHYARASNEALLYHRWMQPAKWNAFVDVLRKYDFQYDQYRRKATKTYDERTVAKMVADLRAEGIEVEISPSVTPPDPIRLQTPKGDDRFDVVLDVDRTSFRVKVAGHRAKQFLEELDSETKEEMKRDDKIAYLKEHPIAKQEIAVFKRTLKETDEKLGDKVDKFIIDNLKHHLPRDDMWHFVNTTEQTIPIGFVYHYVLDMEGYNTKIIDNRQLFLREKTPVEPSMIYTDPKTGKTEVFQLREYQEEAIEAAIDKKSGIVAAATGSGKTEIGAFIIAGQGLDAVWFAHRGELIRQAEDRIEKRLGVDVGAYGGGKKEIVMTPGMDINVMTVQSASEIMRESRATHQKEVNKWQRELERVNQQIDREQNSQKKLQFIKRRDSEGGVQEQLTKAKMKLQVYDYVQQANVQIFDESHHLTSLQFGDIARATPQARYRYGLSATPWGNTSTDQRRIEAIMGKSVADITATELINKGFLAKPNILMVSIPHTVDYPADVVYPKSHKKRGQFKKTVYGDDDTNFHELKQIAVVKNDTFNDYVADFTIDCQKAGLNTMVLVQEVEHGNLVQSKLEDRGLTADFLNAQEKVPTDQQVILDRFKAGKTDTIVATFGKAGEGVDIPGLDVVVLADGYKALVPTMQAVGRAMRIPIDSDKKECLIIDFDRKEKHYGWHPSKPSHKEERLQVYTFEPAFEVKPVSVSEADEEIKRVARINKAERRVREPMREFDLDQPERFLTRAQRREARELGRIAERMETIGTLEKTRVGRRLVVSREAKFVTSRYPNISPVYAQQVMNIYSARGYDPQEIEWDNIDSSLEPAEALKASGILRR